MYLNEKMTGMANLIFELESACWNLTFKNVFTNFNSALSFFDWHF
jgi:hypothetical protein